MSDANEIVREIVNSRYELAIKNVDINLRQCVMNNFYEMLDSSDDAILAAMMFLRDMLSDEYKEMITDDNLAGAMRTACYNYQKAVEREAHENVGQFLKKVISGKGGGISCGVVIV